MPRFSYFISRPKQPVTEDSLIWREPIPLRLDALLKNDGESVSHADYFRAAQSFLEANSYEVIIRAVSRQLDCVLQVQDLEEIHICLEKHGQFYHPARIETRVNQRQFSFVLNVAISETGRRFIEREYQHLKRLNAELPFDYLPQVYGIGRISGSAGLTIGMFLGEWFDGYHEFHISIDPADKKPKINVWDLTRGRFFLSAGQTKTLYTRASKILTGYYNLESFEQIFSWHHAAGDFVVQVENGRLDLKLITIRQYAAIFDHQKDTATAKSNVELILQALLIFFLNLSIRMRLDRLDGIGLWVWSDKAAVEAALTGFLEALALKPDIPSLPDSPLACFMAYLSSCTATDLYDLAAAIVGTFHSKTQELPVVKKNLNEHAETLYHSIQQMLSID